MQCAAVRTKRESIKEPPQYWAKNPGLYSYIYLKGMQWSKCKTKIPECVQEVGISDFVSWMRAELSNTNLN